MDLKEIDIDDLQKRLIQLSDQYSSLNIQLLPLLQKAVNIEKEMTLISEELTKRNGNS